MWIAVAMGIYVHVGLSRYTSLRSLTIWDLYLKLPLLSDRSHNRLEHSLSVSKHLFLLLADIIGMNVEE